MDQIYYLNGAPMRDMRHLPTVYEAPIRDTIRIRYDTDTPIRKNFEKSISDTGAIRYLKINFKIKYI